MKKLILVTAVSLFFASAMARAGTAARNTREYRDEKTDLTILSALVDLPADGRWQMAEAPSQGLADVYITPTKEAQDRLKGKRYQFEIDKHKKRRGRYPLRSYYWSCLEYAKKHDGKAPADLAKLETLESEYRRFTAGEHEDYYFIPGRRLLTDRISPEPDDENKVLWNPRSKVEDPVIMGFETAPPIDDGKHWVLMSNGDIERREIDRRLFEKYNAELERGMKPARERLENWSDAMTYRILARRSSPPPGAVTLTVSNIYQQPRAHIDIEWDPAQRKPGDREMLEEWNKMRVLRDLPVTGIQRNESTLLHYWLRQMDDTLYGIPGIRAAGRRGGRRDRRTSVFGILGGRAAIRETLQLQNLADNRKSTENARTLPVSEIEGVTVESHPFEEMLGDSDGGQLEIADLIPPDRFLAYFAEPQSILQFLDGGSDFIFRAGSSFTGRCLERHLVERYLAKMGMSETWLRTFLKAGAVEELVVAMPDLFVIDGTEFTAVARLKNAKMAKPLLTALGIDDLEGGTVRETRSGGQAFWALREDFLIVSTHQDEFRKVMDLHANDGRGSLGRSAEFRYMLTQQPIEDQTQMYVYFSDSFIRRLVGPEVKIGQLRRLQARFELESITSGALLYKYDGHSGKSSLDKLTAMGYVDLKQPLAAADARLGEDYTASSPAYGSPADMASLLDNPVTHVTRAEKKLYVDYVEDYNRYWRQYFDPIAIRLNTPTEQSYELSIFILPLIDSALYEGLKKALATEEDEDGELIVPEIKPAPVASVSLNIPEKAWVDFSEGLRDELFEEMLGLDGALLDYLGPDVHLAVADAAPIIGTGSGDLADVAGAIPRFNDDMMEISAMISMLTRPCALLVGVKDPDAVRHFLRNAKMGMLGDRNRWFDLSVCKVTGEDKWLFTWNAGGILHTRFGVEVKDRYLVIKNLPLTTSLEVVGRRDFPGRTAHLRLDPAACEEQLPALFASAAAQRRAAALSGIRSLSPLLLTIADSVEEAQDAHADLLGYTPLHPGDGEWIWDSRTLNSSVYGRPAKPLQPPYEPGDRDFGVLQGVKNLEVDMRLEGEGFHATTRWTVTD